LDITISSVEIGFPLIVVGVLSRFEPVHRRLPRPVQVASVVAATSAYWAIVFVLRGWQGGHTNTAAYSAALFALVLAAVLPTITMPTRRELGVVFMLTFLPVSQAFGTSNPLWLVGANAFASWFALVVWAVTKRPNDRPLASLLSWVTTASMVVLIAVVVFTGVLFHPYRTTPFASDTAAGPGLNGVRIAPDDAHRVAVLRRAIIGYTDGKPVPILALDKMPGLIFMVGGSAAGEPWTGPDATRRAAAVFRDACHDKEVGADNPPYLLYNRPPAERDIKALASCGFHFPADFLEVRLSGSIPGLRLFVPSGKLSE
jgi:hypothetical protein